MIKRTENPCSAAATAGTAQEIAEREKLLVKETDLCYAYQVDLQTTGKE